MLTLKGVVSKDNIHLHVSYPPKLSISDMLKRLKGRSAKILLEGIFRIKEAILRRSFMGHRLWSLEYR